MVGIVIVSHCQKLAEGVVELAGMMAANVPLLAAGGKEDGSFGTSYDKIMAAIEEIYTDDGVVMLMDLGSAVLTTETVLEAMEGRNIRMVDCPLVEGAVAASVAAEGNGSMLEVVRAAQASRYTMKL